LTKEHNRFVFMSGTGYVFAQRSFVRSWVSRGSGSRWCKRDCEHRYIFLLPRHP